ncbi:MAG: polymerase, sigma 28 subunit, FliA/WhiG subfamily [Acidimicrobiaceae bacterium]|jgi:RNA polymerase sigma-B factor|nr:polymerase, sigma 28 subunit, FliA/WhiG subfamily [Acidimicrobiaceae bacterium]
MTGVAGGTRALDELLREYARSRDPELRDKIVSAHLGLVSALARRFAHRGEPLDDLAQAGAIGLINALDRFDPDLGFEFSAYATKTIIGEMKRHFRDKGWSVRAPRRVQELYLRIGQSVDEMSQRLGRSPTVRELAAETGASEQDVVEALEAGHAYRAASIDAPGPDDETMASRLGEVDHELAHAEHRMALLPHLERLPARERLILHLRFVEDLTQSEIAARVGISQMHVSRLISRSLAMLRAQYADEG